MQLILTRIIYLLKYLKCQTEKAPYSHVKSDLWKLKHFNISRFLSGLQEEAWTMFAQSCLFQVP